MGAEDPPAGGVPPESAPPPASAGGGAPSATTPSPASAQGAGSPPNPPVGAPPEPAPPPASAGGSGTPSATTPSPASAQGAGSPPNAAAPSTELNLVGESVSQNAAVVQEKLYNADQSRDATRQTVTLWLIGLLCAIVGLAFVALFARGASTGFTDKEFFHELKQVLDVLVGPVITLLASAIGFYFGYKQGELGQRGGSGGSGGSGGTPT